ncbi:hypothetical protein IV203_005655 [Nitzschia inconspicua]|uniref:Uncharacterized protein n=1 Tax=Nitzschia inconspicua TaxID=303405 RepID=A0A9K3PG91_9STRA|nr:hypothetical protein IV203_005655 [Nitzschia inconspicua]
MDFSDHAALRVRRTVPLHEGLEEDDDTFVTCSSKVPEEDSSLHSSSHCRTSKTHPDNGTMRSSASPPRRSTPSSKIIRNPKQISLTRSKRTKSGSAHSQQSYDSGTNSYTDSVMTPQRSSSYSSAYSDNQNASQRPSYRLTPSRKSSGSRTPSSNTKKLTIGQDCGLGSSRSFITAHHGSRSSNSTQQSSFLPDLFSMERTFSQDESLADDSQSRRDIVNGHNSNIHSTPVAWKTPFEVDAPREIPQSYQQSYRYSDPDSPSQSSTTLEQTTTDSRLSEEQDAWAGIDALLETKSLDDSFDFSTRDILPSSTVRAMRREDDASVMIDDDASEYSETPYLALKKFTVKKPARPENGMPHLVEASDQDEDSDSKVGRPSSGNGTLFDVFHWSQKENVDGRDQRKAKLNARRVKLQTNSQHDSDEVASLPSLATCREDELSTRSEISDWHSLDDKGSVVTEDFRSVQQELLDQTRPMAPPVAFDVPLSIGRSDTPESSTNPPYRGKLLLDKSVDAYIRKIQKQLPTISENGSPVRRSNVKVGFFPEFDENQSRLDKAALEGLPSLSSFSNAGESTISGGSDHSRKEKEKRDPNQSLSSMFMKSIKGMRAPKTCKPPPKKKGIVNGDEQKYFPDADKEDNNSKRFSANRCLLNEEEE